MIYIFVIVLIVSLFLISRILMRGTAPPPPTEEVASQEASEVERTIVGIMTHPKATDTIKVSTKMLVKEYENVSAMQNRLLLIAQTGEQNNEGIRAQQSVGKKLKTIESKFMQLLLFLHTGDIQKAEKICANILLRHHAVTKAQTKNAQKTQ